MLLLSAITFLAAFLLFQIELIIAKLFLPSYGGSYLVWGACVVFFQAVLLAGYLFAHMAMRRFGTAHYIKIHLILLLLPFLFFPGQTISVQAHASTLPLVLDVFLRLLTTIGPVFLVLSTISLVTQAWLSSSTIAQRGHPYTLYAVSNIGSFVALWSYPFIFEYYLGNAQQLDIWRGLYVLLVLLNILALRTIKVVKMEVSHEKIKTTVTRAMAMRWLLLSAAGVVLFLSVSNIVTYEVAPVPLLWILPLSIYLLSFVLTFKKSPWYPRWIQPLVSLSLVAGVLLYFQAKMAYLPAAWAIILFNIVLFILCLYAQHSLIKSKPSSGDLTFFYVMISLGGFCGGFLTSWVIPVMSNTPVEFLIGLGLIALTYPNGLMRVILVAMMALTLVLNVLLKPHGSLLKMRNFYGIYDVFEKKGVRTFVHGTTLHGLQWSDPDKRFIPLGYYSPLTPMGEVFIKDIFEAKRVAAVGLGAGSIAMFGKPGKPIDFFELDPDVVSIAQKYFWYLQSAPGEVRVAVGDARLSLLKSNIVYDLMVIDAFGGDSVPVHLINKDVVKLYHSLLTERGGILFHIPSRYFDLEPILARIAHDLGAYAAVKNAKQDGLTLRTVWGVMTWDQERFIRLTTAEGWKPLRTEDYKPMRTWSDDFSTVLPIVKFNELWESIKHYKLLDLKRMTN